MGCKTRNTDNLVYRSPNDMQGLDEKVNYISGAFDRKSRNVVSTVFVKEFG